MNIGLYGAPAASAIAISRSYVLAIVTGLLVLILTLEQARAEPAIPKLNYGAVQDFFQLPPGENLSKRPA